MSNIGNKWQCMICGNLSSDFEEIDVSFEEHIKKHSISKSRYDTFVAKNGGLSNIKVKLLSAPVNPELAIISFLNQTWGPTFDLENMSEEVVNEMVRMALNKETLPTVLETMKFTFQIDGISRACSHQLVRVRIGSAFSQRGMRDSYYGDTKYVVPATIESVEMTDKYIDLMEQCSDFYKELFELGVPYQDARFVIPHAATTSVVWTVDFLALVNFCQNRLQNFMQWEINTLARLLRDEVVNTLPVFANALKPRCEISGKCNAFGNLFPGCGKFPLEKPHDRFVFTTEQATKNLKFDSVSVNASKEHNSKVKADNNHWIELAKERVKVD